MARLEKQLTEEYLRTTLTQNNDVTLLEEKKTELQAIRKNDYNT